MSGLVLKDLMVMKKTLGIYAIIGVVYGYMDIKSDRHGMLFAIVLIASAMVPVSAVAYDERCKWDKLACTTPLSRSETVLSRYLLALILTAVSSLFVFGIYLLDKDMSLADNFALTAVMALAAMFYQAVLLPIIIKFGSEKGRMYMMAVLFIPVIAISVIANAVPGLRQWLEELAERSTAAAPFILAGIVAVIYVRSIVLSIRIYKSKDL